MIIKHVIKMVDEQIYTMFKCDTWLNEHDVCVILTQFKDLSRCYKKCVKCFVTKVMWQPEQYILM